MKPEFERSIPYVGPRPFERRDMSFFFGREREISELLSLIIAHRLVLLYAPSGAGKTSLLNAGLLPLLEKEGFELLPVVRVRGLIPADISPEEISNIYIFNTLMSWAEEQADHKQLSRITLGSFLSERKHLLTEEKLPEPRLIIFDQFEELFTFFEERWMEREDFFKQIGDSLRGDPLLRVLFVLREDYLAQMDPFVPLLPERMRTRFRLELLRKEAASMAIEMPLHLIGRTFENGVVKKLIHELQLIRVLDTSGKVVEVEGEFVEPVQLQVVCQNLWSKLGEQDVITHVLLDEIYRKSGQDYSWSLVDQALAEFYESAVRKVVESSQIKEEDLRTWIKTQFITSKGTRGIVQDTSGISLEAVELLQAEHLIRAIELRAGIKLYELIHDRLIDPIVQSNSRYQENKRSEALNYYGKGTLYADQKQNEEAIQAFNKAIELNPKDKLSYHERGRVYYLLQRYEDANRDWDKVIELDPNYIYAYANKSLSLQALGRYNDALKALNKAIELDPNDAWSYHERGRVYHNIKDYRKAVEEYNRSIELDPQYKWAYANKGSALLELGRYDEALKALDKAIELDPKYAYAYHERGRVYHNIKDYGKAIDEYDKVIELDPQYKWAYANKGSALLELGRYDEALKALDKAIELDPKYAYAYHERGRVYHKGKDYGKAIDEYDKVIELDPKYTSAYDNKGSALLELGRYDEALKALDKAIELDPKFAYAFYNRGLIYYYCGEYNKAIEHWDKTIEVDSVYTDAFLGKGAALNKLCRNEEALQVFNHALELDPNNVLGLGNKGITLLLLDKKAEAYETFKKATGITQELIKKNPGEQSFYQDLGWLYYLSNRFGESIDFIKKSLSFTPESPDLHFMLGLVYLAQGNADLSKKAYAEGVERAKLLPAGKAFTKYKDAIEDLEELILLKPETKIEADKLNKSLKEEKEKVPYILSSG